MFDSLIKLTERLDWPVFTLEMRRSKRSEKGFQQTLAVACFTSLAALLIALVDSKSIPELELWFMLAMVLGNYILRSAFALIAVTGYSARTIASEREMQRFESLALCSLSSLEIVIQKAAMPVFYTLAMALVFLPLDILGPLLSDRHSWTGLLFSLWFVAVSFMNTAVGIFCSCLFAKARTASAVALFVVLGGPLLAGQGLSMTFFLFGGFRNGQLYDQFMEGFFTSPLGPVVHIGVAVFILMMAAQRLEHVRRSA